MSRSQFSARLLKREGPFRNREAQLEQIEGHLGALERDPDHFRVLEVIGIGGAGKSRLLKHVRKTAIGESETDARVIAVSLEEEGSSTEIGPLVAIRNQIGIECLLFDTALLAYGRASGQQFSSEKAPAIANSLVVKSIEIAGGASGLLPLLPLGFAIEVFKRLRRRGVKLSRYTPDQFEAIDEFGNEAGPLREGLPHWLGLDIKQATEPTPRFVAFYDSYDRQSRQTKECKAPWLREFLDTLDRGVHLVSSRDPLLWDKEDWGSAIETVNVEELPLDAARQMIEAELGAIPPAHLERLLVASGQLPFFLEAVIEVYKKVASRPGLHPDDLPSSPKGAVRHLLKHLEREEQDLALAMATIQVFDEGIYVDLGDRLGLNISRLRFDEFVTWFFVEQISPEGELLALYKTHDLLTAYVRDSSDHAPARRRCMQAATLSLLLRCGDGARKHANGALLILRAVIDGWESVDEMPQSAVETLLDAVYLLYDAGHWNALALIASDADRDGRREIATVSAFIAALTTRRIDGIPAGITRFEALEPRATRLGRHRRSLELELAYLREIAGDYDGARRQFRELASAVVMFDPNDRTQRRSVMYHADMLIMDGDFPQAARLFQETYEQIGAGAMVDWGEMVRLRAHAYRFSFMFERASEIYTDAMQATAEAPALKAKLHSNLAEACWRLSRLA